ncbi:MAG: hypothetical protein VZS44_02715 [Bacilli bacterium]|nr:hypothetical protein [Bacilli bacterium]
MDNNNLNNGNNNDVNQSNDDVFENWGFPTESVTDNGNVNNANNINNESSTDKININNNLNNVTSTGTVNTNNVVYNNQNRSGLEINQGEFFCASCGTKIFNRNVINCPKCGSSLATVINNNNNIGNLNFNDDLYEPSHGSGIVSLILSIINLFLAIFVFPKYILSSMILSIFFGASFLFRILYYGFWGYLFASGFAVIAFIVNVVKRGRIFRKCLFVIFIGFCIGAVTPIVLKKTNFSFNALEMKKNKLENNKIVYKDDDLTVIQVRVDYDKSDVKVYFKLETSNIDNYKLSSFINIRVNSCNITNLLLSKKDDLYFFSIPYDKLKEYNINEIYNIDFNIEKDKDINIKFELKKSDNDMAKVIGLDDNEIIYSNNYFKIYLDSNYKYGKGHLFVQSLVPNDYVLNISNADFDTEGYINNYYNNLHLYNYGITSRYIYFHKCYDGMRFVKFDYTIYNEDYKEIVNDHVDVSFPKAKIIASGCNKE